MTKLSYMRPTVDSKKVSMRAFQLMDEYKNHLDYFVLVDHPTNPQYSAIALPNIEAFGLAGFFGRRDPWYVRYTWESQVIRNSGRSRNVKSSKDSVFNSMNNLKIQNRQFTLNPYYYCMICPFENPIASVHTHFEDEFLRRFRALSEPFDTQR